MIYCIIDGEKAYPSLSSNIKITRENPELKDKGSYTLDVTFPMSIYENQLKFRHLNRIDVALRKNQYDSVTLIAGCVPVISGIGVVTSVSEKEVKLQIMNANSEFKYVSGFGDIYIDEMLVFRFMHFSGVTLPGNVPTVSVPVYSLLTPPFVLYDDATRSHDYVGDADICVYTPLYDETNAVTVNEIARWEDNESPVLINPEPQYNLLYVMKASLQYAGYEADVSAVDKFPWNRIYVVNTGGYLPHWTLERFMTEFNSLFGLSVTVDGKKIIFGTVDYDAEAVAYECLDEFTMEYDEDGLQGNAAGNLKYNLADSSEKTFYTEIPDEILNNFDVVEYGSEAELTEKFETLTSSEKSQTVFATPTGYFYGRTDGSGGTGYSGVYTLERAGQFNKLVRNADNDSSEDICIVPVTMARMDTKFRKLKLEEYGGGVQQRTWTVQKEEDLTVIMPVAQNDGTATISSATVQAALEDGEDSDSKRTESERMEVFFLGTGVKTFTSLDRTVRMAAVGTDPTIDGDFSDGISFALDRAPEGVVHIGQFHTKKSRIDGKNQRCIKFLSNEIPDPTSIYIFNNKRYVCEKIEIQITDRGIDQVKTGYFYEITS